MGRKCGPFVLMVVMSIDLGAIFNTTSEEMWFFSGSSLLLSFYLLLEIQIFSLDALMSLQGF